MSYQPLNSIPPHELAVWEGEGRDRRPRPPAPGNVWWSNQAPPPAIGTKIYATINDVGPAIVTGYFTQDGWLGIRCDLIDAPDWHKRQNNHSPTGHVFGNELRILGADPAADHRADLRRLRRNLLDDRCATAGHGRRARIQQQIDAIEAELAELAKLANQENA